MQDINDNDEVQFIGILIPGASFNQQPRRNIPVQQTVTARINNVHTQTQEVPAGKQCKYCGGIGKYCQNKMYSKYCVKACYSYLHNSAHGVFSGFCPERMENIFVGAYNDVRRVDLEGRFNYYCPDWLEIPRCMRKGSLCVAIDMGFKPQLTNNIKDHNETGYARYMEAKQNGMA